jgi:hypothetical protein
LEDHIERRVKDDGPLLALGEQSRTRRRIAAVFNLALGEIDPLRTDSHDAILRQEWVLLLGPLLVVCGAFGWQAMPAGPVNAVLGAGLIILFVCSLAMLARRIRFEHRCKSWRWFHIRRACPRCRAVLDPAHGFSVGSSRIWLWIGPSRCDQCDRRWPLLP